MDKRAFLWSFLLQIGVFSLALILQFLFLLSEVLAIGLVGTGIVSWLLNGGDQLKIEKSKGMILGGLSGAIVEILFIFILTRTTVIK